MMSPGGSIALSWRDSLPSTGSPVTKPRTWPPIWPMASCAGPTASTNNNPWQPDWSPMFDRNYYATHPDMMECVSNDELRDRYLIQNLFREGEVVLNYTHADRFVIGGVAVGSGDVRLPDQTEPASAAGHPFLERRELAIVNIGRTAGAVTVDGERFELGNKDCLYVTMGAREVVFSGTGARFYLASCPAHQAF